MPEWWHQGKVTISCNYFFPGYDYLKKIHCLIKYCYFHNFRHFSKDSCNFKCECSDAQLNCDFLCKCIINQVCLFLHPEKFGEYFWSKGERRRIGEIKEKKKGNWMKEERQKRKGVERGKGHLWYDQAEWVGSWYQRVTGFISFISYMSMSKPQTLVASTVYWAIFEGQVKFAHFSQYGCQL